MLHPGERLRPASEEIAATPSPPLSDVISVILPTRRETRLLRACLLPPEARCQAQDAWAEQASAAGRAPGRGAAYPRRLLPLLDDAARRHGFAIEPAFRTVLRSAAYREELRSAALFRIVREALLALRSHEVPVIVLKGVALPQLAYPRPSLRHSHDVDLLVHERDLARAVGALSEMGLTGRSRWPLHREHSATLQHASGMPVKLHVRPFRMIASEHVSEFRSRSIACEVAGVPTRALSSADSLLQVCGLAAHGAGRKTLVWVCDAWFILARAPQLDWEALARTAAATHLALPLYVMLRYLANELGAPVPPDALAALGAAAPDDSVGRELALAAARRGAGGSYAGLLARCRDSAERRLIFDWLLRPSPTFVRWDCPVPAARPLPLFQLYRAARHVGRRLRRVRG